MFSKAIDFLEAGVEKGWHTGGELCVRKEGEVLEGARFYTRLVGTYAELRSA